MRQFSEKPPICSYYIAIYWLSHTPSIKKINLFIACPLGCRFRPGFFSIENIVHQIEQPPRISVAGNQGPYQFVRKRAGVTPGADPHADVAIRAHLAPIIKTGFRIQFPAQGAVEFFLIIQQYGIRWATVSALFANPTKIFDTDVHRFIGNQREVRCHRTQSDPGT